MILITKQKLLIRPKISFLQIWFVKQLKNRSLFYQTKKFWISVVGTGLLALPLAKQAQSITLVDISEKMLEQARLKAEQQDIKNIQFLEQDLLANPLEQQFDLIVVSRVLHHMPDLDATLAMFYHHLRENGQVLIADFVKTDTNHHGFDLAELENKLIQQVFSSVHSQILYSAEELFQGNYSELFLTVAQKSLAD